MYLKKVTDMVMLKVIGEILPKINKKTDLFLFAWNNNKTLKLPVILKPQLKSLKPIATNSNSVKQSSIVSRTIVY